MAASLSSSSSFPVSFCGKYFSAAVAASGAELSLAQPLVKREPKPLPF
jgi:hypothetical protein